MNHLEQLKNKAECISAYLRGERVQVSGKRDFKTREILEWADLDPISLEGGCIPAFSRPGDCYRIAPKPAPKIPEGVFWVRSREDHKHFASLVVCVSGDGDEFWTKHSRYYLMDACKELFWSHDRKTWLTFTGEKAE